MKRRIDFTEIFPANGFLFEWQLKEIKKASVNNSTDASRGS